MSAARPPLRILTLSGSLRARSTNTALLEALQTLAPQGLELSPYEGIGRLPHFTPDLDEPDGELPAEVAAFRARVATADALIIASPEYAHGIPGSFKNALDWLVGGPEFPGKPIMLVYATSRGHHVAAALREVLGTMSGRVLDLTVTVPLLGSSHCPAAIMADPTWAATIRTGLDRFEAMLRSDAAHSCQLILEPHLEEPAKRASRKMDPM